VWFELHKFFYFQKYPQWKCYSADRFIGPLFCSRLNFSGGWFEHSIHLIDWLIR
jgi:hypothetical protein